MVSRMINKSRMMMRRRRRMSIYNDADLPLNAPTTTTCGSKQKFKSSPSSDKAFKFLLMVLIALFAIKCQAKLENPFEAHPIIMLCFCIAIIIYDQVQTHDSQISDYIMLISGAVSSVLLLSILFPHFPGRLILIVPAFLPTILARNKLKQGCCWLYNRVTDVVTHILNWFTRRKATKQPNLPV